MKFFFIFLRWCILHFRASGNSSFSKENPKQPKAPEPDRREDSRRNLICFRPFKGKWDESAGWSHEWSLSPKKEKESGGTEQLLNTWHSFEMNEWEKKSSRKITTNKQQQKGATGRSYEPSREEEARGKVSVRSRESRQTQQSHKVKLEPKLGSSLRAWPGSALIHVPAVILRSVEAARNKGLSLDRVFEMMSASTLVFWPTFRLCSHCSAHLFLKAVLNSYIYIKTPKAAPSVWSKKKRHYLKVL